MGVKAVVYVTGLVVRDETLKNVIAQYKAFENPTEAEFHFFSDGGNSNEGDACYDFISALEIPTTAIVEKAYSTTAKMATACDKVGVVEGDKRVMIHFAWAKVEGKAEKLELMARILREKEEEFADFYSEELNIDRDTIKALLDNDTTLSADEAVAFGYADYIIPEVNACSTFDIDNEPNILKMKKNEKSVYALITKGLTSMLNALKLQDSNGDEIDFPDVEDGANPTVGSKGEIDGAPIPDGTYVMPSLDNATVVFVGGAIDSITPEDTGDGDGADAGGDASDDVVAAAAAAAAADVKAESEIKEVYTYTQTVVNDSFAVGDIVMVTYNDEEYAAGAGEFIIDGGKRVITDSSGEIVFIKDAVSTDDSAADAVAGDEVDNAAAVQAAAVLDGIKDLKESLLAEAARGREELKKELRAEIKSPEFNVDNKQQGKGDSVKKTLQQIMSS